MDLNNIDEENNIGYKKFMKEAINLISKNVRSFRLFNSDNYNLTKTIDEIINDAIIIIKQKAKQVYIINIQNYEIKKQYFEQEQLKIRNDSNYIPNDPLIAKWKELIELDKQWHNINIETSAQKIDIPTIKQNIKGNLKKLDEQLSSIGVNKSEIHPECRKELLLNEHSESKLTSRITQIEHKILPKCTLFKIEFRCWIAIFLACGRIYEKRFENDFFNILKNDYYSGENKTLRLSIAKTYEMYEQCEELNLTTPKSNNKKRKYNKISNNNNNNEDNSDDNDKIKFSKEELIEFKKSEEYVELKLKQGQDYELIVKDKLTRSSFITNIKKLIDLTKEMDPRILSKSIDSFVNQYNELLILIKGISNQMIYGSSFMDYTNIEIMYKLFIPKLKKIIEKQELIRDNENSINLNLNIEQFSNTDSNSEFNNDDNNLKFKTKKIHVSDNTLLVRRDTALVAQACVYIMLCNEDRKTKTPKITLFDERVTKKRIVYAYELWYTNQKKPALQSNSEHVKVSQALTNLLAVLRNEIKELRQN